MYIMMCTCILTWLFCRKVWRRRKKHPTTDWRRCVTHVNIDDFCWRYAVAVDDRGGGGEKLHRMLSMLRLCVHHYGFLCTLLMGRQKFDAERTCEGKVKSSEVNCCCCCHCFRSLHSLVFSLNYHFLRLEIYFMIIYLNRNRSIWYCCSSLCL